MTLIDHAQGAVRLLPDATLGDESFVFAEPGLCRISNELTRAQAAELARTLPAQSYAFDVPIERATEFALGWALGAYEFTRFKPAKRRPQLVWPQEADRAFVERRAGTVSFVRDLITLPANHLGPAALERVARDCAARWGADIRSIEGDALHAAGLHAIHAVGRAGREPPRLLDLRRKVEGAPKVTLVGKGVCFDAGGLHMKSADAMQTMKNDMGGAAHVLALAELLVAEGPALDLRVLLPVVENAIAGNALHPLDVLQIGGRSVEVTFTDAEGRLILADALVAAGSDAPALIVDFATLTESAYAALGTELPAVFANDEALLDALRHAARATDDPLWPMPLFAPYRRHLDSRVADLVNFPKHGYADAICAALFLHGFVPDGTAWVHVDFSAWDEDEELGEARALFALHRFLIERFG
jgi:leucyl aminopeptidase